MEPSPWRTPVTGRQVLVAVGVVALLLGLLLIYAFGQHHPLVRACLIGPHGLMFGFWLLALFAVARLAMVREDRGGG